MIFGTFFLNFELGTLLSAEDVCLSHAPGGERFRVGRDFMQGEAGKRSVTKEPPKLSTTRLRAHVLCGASV